MTDDWLDRPQAPRKGEDLDLDKLTPYLREALKERGELEVEQFPSGHSNLTYLLRLGKQELVLRRPPFGNRVKSAHDMGREYRVLAALHRHYPAPEPLVLCEDEDILGAPFYVMRRMRGIILRKKLPAGMDLPPVLAQRLSESVIDGLAELHRLDAQGIGLGDLGKPEGYVERQVQGWIRRYQNAQTDSWPQIDEVAGWLSANTPEESAAGIVHNDYKYDNLVLDPSDLTQILAVLDWEMCTLGDPLMDLGTTLAYWCEAGDPAPWREAAFGPTALPGSLTRRELVERYAETRGSQPGSMVFYFVFGLFKLAVIVQQIYYRFFKGHTQDARFAQLNQMVGLLGQIAAAAVDRDAL